MFLVSGPELVIAACRSGIIGSFPTANCRTLDELDAWLGRIVGETKGAAPFAPNLIVHKSNNRLMDDAALVAEHRAPMVIASVGSPAPIMETIHEYGGLVFADIASMRHAEKAIATGVDGLILLMAGAGGQTGWANPFAFVRAVRAIFDGPVVLAGGVSDGVALKAAVTSRMRSRLYGDALYRDTGKHGGSGAQGYARDLVAGRCDVDQCVHRIAGKQTAPVDCRGWTRSGRLAGARDDRHYERHQSGQTAQTLEGYLVRRTFRIGRERYSER